MCGGLAAGPARGRDGEGCPRHGRARRRLQQRSAPQRLERLAPGGVERRDVEVLVVELHVAPLALGVGAVPGEADAEQHRQGGVAAGHAGGVDAIGEPGHRAGGKERDHERDEVAAVVAPEVAHRRPGAEIEEDVVGVQDHVHGRALGRGRDDDHGDQRRRQRWLRRTPGADNRTTNAASAKVTDAVNRTLGNVAFVDPEVPGQDGGNQGCQRPGRPWGEFETLQQPGGAGTQPREAGRACGETNSLIRHGSAVRETSQKLHRRARRR